MQKSAHSEHGPLAFTILAFTITAAYMKYTAR